MPSPRPDETSAVAAAFGLIDREIPVIPVAASGKLPLTKNGSKDAATARGTVEFWHGRYPACNFAAVTGHPLPEGGYLYALDVDGDEGAASLAGIEKEIGQAPDTLRVRTARGWHYYLRSESPLRNLQAKGDRWANLDIRGTNGYVICAGSVHETGAIYEYADGPDVLIAEWPELEALLTRARPRARASTPAASGQTVGAGGRNNYMASVVGTLRDKDLPYEAAVAAARETNTRVCVPPLDEGELGKVVDSIYRNYEPSNSAAAEAVRLAAVASILDTLDEHIKLDPTYPYHPAVVPELAAAEEAGGAQWDEVRRILKRRGVTLTGVVKAIREWRAATAPKPEPSVEFADAPVQLKVPGEWRLREDGVWKIKRVEGQIEEVWVLPCPLTIVRRLKTVDTGEEKIELAWRRDGGWQRTICDRSVIATTQAITALSDQGLPVTSGDAKDVVQYLRDLEAANQDALPPELATERTGWLGAGRFYPGAANDVAFAAPGWSLTHMFDPVGSLDEWVAGAAAIRSAYPIARLQLAAAFAAPLLDRVGFRNFVIHLWGNSRGGKTAVMQLAASVWGAGSLVIPFSGTTLGFQNQAAMLCDLPLCINERQVVRGKHKLDDMIYTLAEGRGKVQGARAGGNRQMRSWHTIVLTNGEEPLASAGSTQGLRTRTIEIEGEPITVEADAQRLYELVEANHGLAGPAFMQHIVAMERVRLTELWRQYRVWLATDDHIAPHTDMIALCAAADEIAGEVLFGTSRDDTLAWAQVLIHEHVPHTLAIDQATASYDAVCNLLTANRARFGRGNPNIPIEGENWGFMEGDITWVNASILQRELERASFGYSATIRAIAAQDKIEWEKNGTRRRYAIRKSGARFHGIHVALGGQEDNGGQVGGQW